MEDRVVLEVLAISVILERAWETAKTYRIDPLKHTITDEK